MIFGPMSQFHGLLCNCEIFANLRLKLYLTRAHSPDPPGTMPSWVRAMTWSPSLPRLL